MELGDELSAALDAFCKSRGELKADVVRMAIRRHMANPPSLGLPPLPPLPPSPDQNASPPVAPMTPTAQPPLPRTTAPRRRPKPGA